MALSAAVELQDVQNTDGTSFTSASATPTNGALYVVFVVGRTGDAAHRVPTLAGTNGWNTTWTRVSGSQAIYSFAAVNRCGTEVFWGLASSGTSGTLTADFGGGTSLWNCTFHALRIDGGPHLTVPIGVTGSAHDDTAGVSTVTATLTGTPAVTSIVLATGASDLVSGTMSASSGYATLGSIQTSTGGAGNSQPEYDEAPSGTSVGVTFSAGPEIMSVSAVEILIAGGAAAAPSLYQNVSPRRW